MRAGIYARVSDEGNDRSPEQQAEAGREAARLRGWRVVGEWEDQRSASRYARRARPEWPVFVGAVRAGLMDVAVLWESSRGGRELENWAGFLNACRDRGVKVYITSRDKLYDLGDSEDYRTLAMDGVSSVYESELISVRSRRGMAAAVQRGQATGRLPYGYRREYERIKGRPKPVVTQLPDSDTAPVAREIITRIAAGESVSALVRDLNERGVLNPSGQPGWSRSTIIRLVKEGVVYIGQRRHNGGPLVPGDWPALVDEDLYWRAVAVLADPARKKSADDRGGIRPGAAKWLLSHIARCAKCGAPLGVTTRPRGGQPVKMYRCSSSQGGCAMAPVEWLDFLVTGAVIAWCARPQIYEVLTAGDDREAQAARDEAAAESARLADLEAQVVDGRISTATFGRVAGQIEARIESLQARANELSVPPTLRSLAGPDSPAQDSGADREDDLRDRWGGMPLAARRSVISTLAQPTLAPDGRGGDPLSPWRVEMNFRAP